MRAPSQQQLEKLGLEASAIEALAPALGGARAVDYAAGTALYHQGADIEALYIVRYGKIKLVNYLDNGRARIVRLHKRGDIIGLNGLVGECHEHTAITIEDTSVYQIAVTQLAGLRDKDPAAYSGLIEQWRAHLSRADQWITDFSTGPIRGRVARLVRFLAELDEQSGPREVTLLSGAEMSEVLGVTPESVSRVLAEYKRTGVLRACGDGERYKYDCRALAREARA